jgi:hypothetical protein
MKKKLVTLGIIIIGIAVGVYLNHRSNYQKATQIGQAMTEYLNSTSQSFSSLESKLIVNIGSDLRGTLEDFKNQNETYLFDVEYSDPYSSPGKKATNVVVLFDENNTSKIHIRLKFHVFQRKADILGFWTSKSEIVRE